MYDYLAQWQQQQENEAWRWHVETATETNREDNEMPNVNEMFPSKWLKATDLPRPVTVTIDSIEQAEMPGGELKWVVYFRGKEKGMVLNRTNAEQLVDFFGDESDNWRGKSVKLFAMRVQGPNGPTQGIRLRQASGAAQAASAAAPAAAPVEEEIDDDIPF